jgi:hypothetical protein
MLIVLSWIVYLKPVAYYTGLGPSKGPQKLYIEKIVIDTMPSPIEQEKCIKCVTRDGRIIYIPYDSISYIEQEKDGGKL